MDLYKFTFQNLQLYMFIFPKTIRYTKTFKVFKHHGWTLQWIYTIVTYFQQLGQHPGLKRQDGHPWGLRLRRSSQEIPGTSLPTCFTPRTEVDAEGLFILCLGVAFTTFMLFMGFTFLVFKDFMAILESSSPTLPLPRPRPRPRPPPRPRPLPRPRGFLDSSSPSSGPWSHASSMVLACSAGVKGFWFSCGSTGASALWVGFSMGNAGSAILGLERKSSMASCDLPSCGWTPPTCPLPPATCPLPIACCPWTTDCAPWAWPTAFPWPIHDSPSMQRWECHSCHSWDSWDSWGSCMDSWDSESHLLDHVCQPHCCCWF